MIKNTLNFKQMKGIQNLEKVILIGDSVATIAI